MPLTFISGSIDSLAEKIEFSLENIEKLRKNAEKGQQDVLKRFNWDTITDQYLELFNGK